MSQEYDLLKNDWQMTEGILDAGFEYGPQRYTTGMPDAPASGVKVRKLNPTQSQIISAASTVGLRSTDGGFTVWSNTLRADPSEETSTAIVPVENDRLVVEGVTWVIKTVKKTVYDTQFLVYCWQSTATPE